MALNTYSTGTVAIGASATSVVGTGTLWNDPNVRPGDLLVVGGHQVIIEDVVDATHLTIDAWPFSAITAGTTYKIVQNSFLRVGNGAVAQDVSTLISALNTTGYFVFVGASESVPDPSLGEDGQFAYKPGTGQLWLKTGGSWVLQGTFKGFNITGAWSGATAYNANDVVSSAGSSYICILGHTNHVPPNATYWVLLSSIGATGPAALNPVVAWVTAHAYVAGPPADLVFINGSTYECLVSHTSGVFATDLAANKWALIAQAGTNGTNGAGYGGTSATSFAVATGSKAFTTQAGLAYSVGSRVRASSAANTANYMEGLVTAYSSTTLTINITVVGGTGTHTDWNLSLIGEPGAGAASALQIAQNLSDLASIPTALLNIGVEQSQRSNAMLDRIHTSKIYLAVRRALTSFADGFGATDGVNAGASSNYSINVSPKNVTATTSFSRLSGGTPTAPLGGTAANINDNNTGTTITYTGTNLSAAAINSRILAKIDYGSNKTITEIEAVGLSQSAGGNSGTGLYYSTDGTTWTQLGANLPTTNTTPTTTTRTGSVTARYIAIILPQTDFTSANVTLQDLNGYISTPNNVTFVTAAQTTDASASNGFAIIEYDASATPTLNTDLTAEITCNGGTNWTAATLSLLTSHGQGGRSVAISADVACTAGTSFAVRIKTFNNKAIPMHGLAGAWH